MFNLMDRRTKAVSRVAACVVVIGVSLSAPIAASAAEVPAADISGYSKETFVNAAVAEGVSAEVAATAWGNEFEMSRIPVSSELAGGGDASVAPASGFSGRALILNYSGSCVFERKNAFGGVLQHFAVSKSWQVNSTSSSVIPNETSVSAYGGYTWVYAGIVNSSDSYSGSSHKSYRMGLFDTAPSIEQENHWVQIVANYNGTYGCSKG